MPYWAFINFNVNVLSMSKKGRPKCLRVVRDIPDIDYFKPRGIPLKDLESVRLKVEELEAIRLVDFEGLKQKDAANEMGISRRTLARELKSGRMKTAEALIKGKAIEIKGGHFITKKRSFICKDCGYEWVEPSGTGRPKECPECKSNNIQRRSDYGKKG